MIPGIVVHLIEGVIVVCRRIERLQEILLVNHQGFFVVLCQEVIAIAGIGIAHTAVVAVPGDGSHSIEQPLTTNHTG